jgi:predicted lipid-binding transport protein (Tim44 family)
MVVLSSLSFLAVNVEAKRLGGGTTSGMKRQAPPPQQPAQPAPAKPAATPSPTNAAATPAPAPKRSWMGPLAGLAAGLGLAALFSHFGMGGEFGSLLTMLLIAGVAFFAIRFLMQRFGAQRASAGGLQYAGAGAGAGHGGPVGFGSGSAAPVTPTAFEASPGANFGSAAAGGLPAGFDAAGFERIAKLIFIRMQAANDAGNLEDLRQFSTPEMFATFRLDLQERGGATQQTDVMQLNAQVLEVAEEAGQQIVSVRFHGLIGEHKNEPAVPFDETWHLVKQIGGDDWKIAGIAQG